MNVVITGASQGIGFAVAEEFAKAGYTLCLVSKSPERIKKASETLQQKYPQAIIHFMAADLAQKKECIDFANWCLGMGTPTILVNNAGHFLPGNIIDEKEDHLEAQLATNLLSAYLSTRSLLPAMLHDN
jgi:short-subunit dehydrogenase